MSHLHGADEADDLDMEPGVRVAPPNEPDELNNPLRELLAAYAHEAWSGWMHQMFEYGGYATIEVEDNGQPLTFWTMKPEKYERWQRQMKTPYADLPESEKPSDRQEAASLFDLIVGGLDLGGCLLIPVGSDPKAIAELLERALPPEAWVKFVQVVLDVTSDVDNHCGLAVRSGDRRE